MINGEKTGEPDLKAPTERVADDLKRPQQEGAIQGEVDKTIPEWRKVNVEKYLDKKIGDFKGVNRSTLGGEVREQEEELRLQEREMRLGKNMPRRKKTD